MTTKVIGLLRKLTPFYPNEGGDTIPFLAELNTAKHILSKCHQQLELAKSRCS